MSADMSGQDRAVWLKARPHLDVRNNDEHTLQAYWLARALLDSHPGAREDIVLPAILFHDVGWKRVPQDQMFLAFGPNATRPDLVRLHETEGAAIARAELTGLGLPLDEIAGIIDGHDTRKAALSTEDAIVKDADKVWRFTPHGIAIMAGWFDWTLEHTIAVQIGHSLPQLLTEPGRAMARAFIATGQATAATPELMRARS